MRQLTLAKARRLEWWDVPAPTIESGAQAIVRADCVARCDLDRYMFVGPLSREPPFAFGHEMVATVIDVGADVRNVVPGQQVVVPFQISCGTCSNCQRGWTNACGSVPPLAAYGLGTHPEGDWGGAFSDLLKIPFADAMLLALPQGVSPEAACGAGDNIADGYRTVAELLVQFPQEPVLVVGGLAQSVGLYAVMAALALGSAEVVYADNDANRLAIAGRLGATVVNADFNAEKAHASQFLISVDAAATPEGLAYALRSTAPCGHCTSVSGGVGSSTSLPLGSMYLKGITHRVSRVHSRNILPKVLGHMCCGELDPLEIDTPVLDFEDAADAMGGSETKLIFRRKD